MKKFLTTLLALASLTSFAQTESCREQLEDKLLLRNAIGGVTTLTSTATATSIAVGASAAAFPALLPIAVGTTAAGGAYWIISTSKPRRLIKLIDQAQTCRGKILEKAYKAYEKVSSTQRLTKEEFCDSIVQSDRDGSLCVSSVPSVKDVGRYYID